jgi:hypothetical protein
MRHDRICLKSTLIEVTHSLSKFGLQQSSLDFAVRDQPWGTVIFTGSAHSQFGLQQSSLDFAVRDQPWGTVIFTGNAHSQFGLQQSSLWTLRCGISHGEL